MATAEQVKALLKSYSQGDGEHFVSVALQIAAHEARTGKGKLAQELRNLVDDIKRKESAGRIGGAVPIARPTGELAGLLAVTYPKTRLSEMVLSDKTRDRIERVLREYRQRDKLRAHSLSARRKLLLIGPPGCGKTMTASALAGELKLPLFSVQLHGLITKYMGETAAKLHVVFEAKRDLLDLIRNGENSGVEFKREPIDNRQLARELVAFANLDGGRALLGVDDDGTVCGVTQRDLEARVMTTCRDKIRPEIIPYFEMIRDVEPRRHGAVVQVDARWTGHHVWYDNPSRLLGRARFPQFSPCPTCSARSFDRRFAHRRRRSAQ